MSSLVTKLLAIFFVWYASMCLASSVLDEYSISNLDLDVYTSEKEVFHLFQMWKKENEREYQTLEEEEARFQIFKSNLKYVREKNAKRESPDDYCLGLNQFSDMSYEEFSKIYLHEKENPIMEGNNSNMILNDASCLNAPSSWDWRTKGVVTRVKDQRGCGSCWAFSATGAIEGITKIVSGKLLDLSEQQLISCDKGNQGCKGGWYGNAFQYVINNRGITSQATYPYTASDSACDSTKAKKIVAIINGHKAWDHPISESSLRDYVYKQPVSVSLYASGEFKSYSARSGIFKGNDCTRFRSCKTNHDVLIVGYGSSKGQDYWIIKNSWGTRWGEKGYARIKRNTGSKRGVCNINCSGAYPIKPKKEIPDLELATSL